MSTNNTNLPPPSQGGGQGAVSENKFRAIESEEQYRITAEDIKPLPPDEPQDAENELDVSIREADWPEDIKGPSQMPAGIETKIKPGDTRQEAFNKILDHKLIYRDFHEDPKRTTTHEDNDGGVTG